MQGNFNQEGQNGFSLGFSNGNFGSMQGQEQNGMQNGMQGGFNPMQGQVGFPNDEFTSGNMMGYNSNAEVNGVGNMPFEGQGMPTNGQNPQQTGYSFAPEQKKKKEKKLKKEKKPKKEKPIKQVPKEDKPKKKIPFWVVIVGIVVVFFVVAIVSSLFKGKTNYKDDFNKILYSDGGTYKYVIDVRTSKHTKDSDLTAKETEVTNIDASQNEAKDVEGTEENEEAKKKAEEESGKHDESISNQWGNKEDTQTASWKYPSYKVTVEGGTKSLNPIEASYKVSIATELFTDVFTDVTCYKENCYINLEQMRYWLTNSKDAYLVQLGKQIPEGSKYLCIPLNDVAFVSRFSEDSEQESATCKGYETLRGRNKIILQSLTDALFTAVGEDAFYREDDMNYISVTDGGYVLQYLSNYINNVGGAYDSYLTKAVDAKLYTKDELKQAKKEKDNIIDVFNDFSTYMQVTNLSKMAFNMNGASKEYQNSDGATIVEATMNLATALDGVDYKVSCSLMRSSDIKDITKPQGSTTSIDALDSDLFMQDILYPMADYFNVFSFKLSNKLESTPTGLATEVLQEFINMVNASGVAPYLVTMNNVADYISTYTSMNVNDGTSAKDLANINMITEFELVLLQEFFNLKIEDIQTADDVTYDRYLREVFRKLFPNMIKEDQLSEGSSDEERYPTLETDLNGVALKLHVNKEESNDQLMVVDIVASSEAETALDLTGFSVRTLQSSVYPANNTVLLRDYDNNWDFDNTVVTMSLPEGKSEVSAKLYFVTSADTGYMDIWYGETNLGEIINH